MMLTGYLDTRSIVRAKLLLPVYGRQIEQDNPDGPGIVLGAEMSYANEKAQNFLRKATKPCFDDLRQIYRELSREDLTEMREAFDRSVRVYDRLMGLEKSLAKIPKSERAAIKTIRQKIENCLDEAEGVKLALRRSTYEVEYCVTQMRRFLEAYGELLQHLENHSKEQYFKRLFAKLEAECKDYKSHPILELDVHQERLELLWKLY